MPTFLELCQDFHKDVGGSGTISTVIGQTGMLKRYVDWIAKADYKIQSRKSDWNFLWNEWELTLVENIPDYSPPDGLGMFDKLSFWKDAGTINAYRMTWIEYKTWRDYHRNSCIDADESSFVTIKPNGMVLVCPTPNSVDAGSIITADYWRSPVKLVNNNQYSLIPEQFHDLIISQAKVYHAEYRHDTGAYNAAYLEHEQRYPDLKSHSLPGRDDDNKSEAIIPKIIQVQ